MRRTGLVDLIGENHWFLSDEAAVVAPFTDPVARTEEPPPAEALPADPAADDAPPEGH